MHALKIVWFSFLLLCLSGCLKGNENSFKDSIDLRMKLLQEGQYRLVSYNNGGPYEKKLFSITYDAKKHAYRGINQMEVVFLHLTKEYFVLKEHNIKKDDGEFSYTIIKKTNQGFTAYHESEAVSIAINDMLGGEMKEIYTVPFNDAALNQQFYVNLINNKKYRSKFKVLFTFEKV